MIKDCIIVDLDGTLADCEHRVHLAQARQWEEFHGCLHLDTPQEAVREIVLFLGKAFRVIVVTGRTENFRIKTQEWLARYDVFPDILLMRPEQDFRKDTIIKLEMIETLFGSLDEAKMRVRVVLEDRDVVVEAYRNAGFECWQVRSGSY